MAMAERMVTPTDLDILTLTQWMSPAYPIGGFAYSHGLEWAIETDAVRDAHDSKAWIADVITHGSGRNDSLFLIAAYTSETFADLQETDTIARAFCPSFERLMETKLLGEAFCTITSNVWGVENETLTYPVAVGRAAKLVGLSLPLTSQMYLQAFLSNLVACATRLVPLGQTEGQRIIRDLTPLCQRVAIEAEEAGLDNLGSTAFLADIASMKHETQYSRMFRT